MTSLDSDYAAPPPSAIPEFASFEHQKENIQPLRQGRSATTLAHLFSAPHPPDHSQMHAQFARELAALDDLDDPLDVFARYIRWTIEAYPQGPNHDSNLVPLLEQATRRFKDDVRYRNDPRYLRCWLLYANYVKEPKEIFVYLMGNDIGTQLAALYEDYATLLEKMQRSDEAEKIYALGIARHATPLDRLKRRHQQFRTRAMQRALQQHSDDDGGPDPDSVAVDPSRRTILGSKTSARSTRSAPLNEFTARHSTAEPPAGGTFGAAGTGTVRKPNSKISVFVDPDGAAAAAASQQAKQMAAPWTDIGTEGSRRKENIREATAWVGVTMPQKGGVKDGVEKIEVYRDEPDPSNKPATRHSPTTPGLRTVAKPSETELLKNNPLKNFGPADTTPVSAVPVSVTPVSTVPRTSKGKTEKKSLTERSEVVVGTKRERMAVALDLVYIEEEEFCFEEVRARERRYQEWGEKTEAPKERVVLEMEDEDEDEEDEDVPARRAEEMPRTPVKEFSIFAPPSKPRAMPSPTINTKAALADIMEIFNQPLKCERGSDGDSDNSDSGYHHRRVPRQVPPKIPIYRDENAAPGDESAIRGGETMRSQQQQRNPLAVVSEPKFLRRVTDENDPRGVGFEEVREKWEKQSTSFMEKSREGQAYDDDDDDDDDYDDGYYPQPWQEMASKPFEVYGDNEDTRRSHDDAVMYDEPLRDMPGRLYHRRANAAFDPLTPITERSGEYDRSTITGSAFGGGDITTNSTLHATSTFHGFGERRPSLGIGEGYTIPGIDSGVFSVTAEIRQEEKEQERRRLSSSMRSSLPRSPLANIRPPAPRNPMDSKFIAETLATLDPPLQSYPGFHDYRDESVGMLKAVERAARRAHPAQGRRASNVDGDTEFVLKLGKEAYGVIRKLGEGGYAKVYLVKDLSARSTGEELDVDLGLDLDHTDEIEQYSLRALKIEVPASAWEFYILRQLHSRLSPQAARFVVSPHALHLHRDESHLLLEYCDQGTLLDAVNALSREGTVTDELLAVFFAIELLRAVDAMHEAGVIHGDLKPDNCLLRLLEPSNGSEWEARYDPEGGHGWDSKGIRLIDFGRAIDLTLYSPGTEFLASWETDEHDCPEMREGKPWAYQADYHGVAGIAHVLLHGKYMETAVDAAGWRRPVAPWKRYWQGEMWGKLFDLLLNSGKVPGGKEGVVRELRKVRTEMEMWLVENGGKSAKSLKGMLRKLEIVALEARGRN